MQSQSQDQRKVNWTKSQFHCLFMCSNLRHDAGLRLVFFSQRELYELRAR